MFQKITNKLIENNIINAEDEELYTYGFKQGAFLLLNVITTIVLGFILGMAWQSIVFLIVYVPLRSYAGGYHANTSIGCYIFSIFLVAAVLLIIKMITWTSINCLIVTLAVSVMIMLLVPVEDRNKPLDKTEIKVYRKYTAIVLSIEVCINIVLIFFELINIASCITVTIAALFSMLILGLIKNKWHKSHLKEVNI